MKNNKDIKNINYEEEIEYTNCEDYFEEPKYEQYFNIENIKIDKEYYEKLKTVDYSEVRRTLYSGLEEYQKYIIESVSILIDELEYEDYEKELDPEIKTELDKYGSPQKEIVMLVAAYVLVLLQEPSLVNKFDLISNLKNSNLPDDIKNLLLPYISDNVFQDSIFSLINKFEKDELLAFIVFGFGFEDCFKYFNYAEKNYSFPINPLSNGISKLLLNILDIKDEEKVLNLYSNIGDFLIESFLDNPNTTIYGNDRNYYDIPVLKTSLFSNNIKINLKKKTEEKIDKIFLNLSLIPHHYQKKKVRSIEVDNRSEITKKYRNKCINDLKIKDEIVKNASLEWLMNILSINQLKDDGKAVCLVERNILFDIENADIRKYFIENGYIESIIFLPKNILIPYPSTLVLIVFSKGNKKIRFIDAYNFGKLEKIKEQDINILTDNDGDKIIDLINKEDDGKACISKEIENYSEENYSLIVVKNIELFIEILEESKKGVKLKELTDRIIKGSQAIEEFRTDEKTQNIYLSISDINDGLIDFENIETYLKEIPENQEKFCLKNNSILLSKYRSSPKLGIAQVPNNMKIIPSGNFIIIEVNEEKLNPWYLMAFFSTPFGSKNLIETSANYSTLSIKKIEDITLQLPSMKEQEKIGKQYRESLKKIEDMKKKLKNEIQNSKEIYIKNGGGLL